MDEQDGELFAGIMIIMMITQRDGRFEENEYHFRSAATTTYSLIRRNGLPVATDEAARTAERLPF
jgi:hypothetical protein